MIINDGLLALTSTLNRHFIRRGLLVVCGRRTHAPGNILDRRVFRRDGEAVHRFCRDREHDYDDNGDDLH